MAKRPPLKDLPITGRKLAKPAEAPRTPTRAAEARGQRDFKGVMARINRAGWKELGQLSIELDAPFQQMFVEALNDYLRKHHRPPLVEGRVLPKDD